jgi:uncharacterized membrane protein HdeD (DUF308 family)
LESVTETARVLLTAAIVSAVALTTFVWRLTRLDRAPHQRLVDQLYLSQWAALLLAASGAVSLGLAVSAASAPGASLEVVAGLATIGLSLMVLRREPREALLSAAVLFLLHALFLWAHRPSLIVVAFVPDWWITGSAMYDVYLAALCLVATRRVEER